MSDPVILRFSTGKWTIHCSIKFTFCCTTATRSCGLEFVWKALLVSLFLWKGLFSVNFTIQRVTFGRDVCQKKSFAYGSTFSKIWSRGGTYRRATRQAQAELWKLQMLCFVIHIKIPLAWHMPLVIVAVNLA